MDPRPVAIVTAAGRGIGAAIARELATRGWRLALMSVSGNAETLAKQLGQLGLTGSITAPEDIERLVATTLDRHGRIDGVVNNAGPLPKLPVLEVSDAQWRAGFEMILMSVIRMARLVTPVMAAQGKGAIVNISTFTAFEPDRRLPISSTLRAALGGFAKLYADEWAAKGIRMNNVLPGYVDNLPSAPETLARIPLGRYAKLAEIAKTVAFLLSDDAGYITGQNLRVDGGVSRAV